MDDRVKIYRRVFGSEQGQAVLADLLNELGFFSDRDEISEEDVWRMRVARQILARCGGWQPKAIPGIVEHMVTIQHD